MASSNDRRFIFDLPDEANTLTLGREIGGLLKTLGLDQGFTLYIQGELGAGKTTLCRGVLRGLGIHGAVKSPTFTLVEPYEVGGCQIFHFDLYRLVDPNELEYIGVDDYFGGQHLCLVEWPERGVGYLPDCDLRIKLKLADESRRAIIEPGTEKGRQICLKLETKRVELQAR